jgi:hypothetical protein
MTNRLPVVRANLVSAAASLHAQACEQGGVVTAEELRAAHLVDEALAVLDVLRDIDTGTTRGDTAATN